MDRKKYNAYQVGYYHSNPEYRAATIERSREWALANHEKRLEITRRCSKKYDGYNQTKSKAKSRKLSWDLTKEQYLAIRKQLCTYCQGSLPPSSGGLDRIDNSKGYSVDNVLPCCVACNQLRNNKLTVDEMKYVMKCLKEYRAGRAQ